MAKTVTQAFTEFKSNLEITNLQESTIAVRQQNLRQNVSASLTVIEDFLTGSYRRSTMIAPLYKADVDVFIVLAPTYYSDPPNGPANILDRLKRAIDKSYSGSTESSRNAQAVTIRFSDFKVDVVPAFQRAGGGYLIPNPKERTWIATNPRDHVRLWSELNQAQDGMLVPLLKMLKCWNRHYDQLLGSFHLEAMARQVFSTRRILSYPEAAAFFFANSEPYVTYLSDPANLGGNLGSYALLDLALSLAIKQRLRKAHQLASDAFSYSSLGKHDVAIAKWQAVFGDHFPKYG